MRLPHADDGARVDGFLFREDVEGRDFNRYLWGNAAFAFGSVLVRAFADCRWLADIRGVERDMLSGGMVSGLPVHCFSTDSWGVAPKASTDVLIVEKQEKQFSELGLIPLCHLPDTEFSAFFANQSAQKPKTYDEPAATTNARLSAMLQYTLCVSRFAHYVKVLARDKVGGFTEPSDVEKFLHTWLQRYVTSDSDASLETRSKWPLREAAVQVRERPGRPGSYYCVAHLRPHFQLDELNAAVKLVTEISQGTNN